MTDTKLLPLRVIVDRTVMDNLLRLAALEQCHPGWSPECARLIEIGDEIESGQRVELYERDWLGGDAS